MKTKNRRNADWEKHSQELRKEANELINKIGHEFRTSPEKIAE